MARCKRAALVCFLLFILLTFVMVAHVHRSFEKLTKMEITLNSPNTSGKVINRLHSNLAKTQFGKLQTKMFESERQRASRPTTHRPSQQTSVMPMKSSNLTIESHSSTALFQRTSNIPEVNSQRRTDLTQGDVSQTQELASSKSIQDTKAQTSTFETTTKYILVNETNDESSFSTMIRPLGDLTYDDIPQARVTAVDCAKLIRGDKSEHAKADTYQKEHPKVIISDQKIYSDAMNCSRFLTDRRYIQKPASMEEKDFPLAFSILLYKDVEQFERLLRAIYRPQNFYCIHVDKASSKSVQDAVGSIVNCFENVFLAPEQFDVQWGTFSILEPELSCMTELLKYKKWRYFINLTGQEFPLRTNLEIVEILRIFNGANNMEGTIKWLNPERIANKPPAPFNITLTKGSVHIVATRAYVEYVIYNETSIKFRDWVKETLFPDETYFSTLNFNPHLQVPGSYLGVPETDSVKNLFIVRFKNWEKSDLFNWPCAGKRVRMICIFSVRDLPLLASRVELFANKFHIDYEPLTLDCLEELHYNRTRLEILNGPQINRTFYKELDFVRNHLK